MATVENFDAVRITNASVQFFEGGTQKTGTKFGFIGTIEGETELKEFIKTVEGIEVDKIVKPVKMNMTVSGHIPVKVARSLFGLSNTDLMAGVYSYGANSKGKKFIFTADVIDEFQEITKLIAFSNCLSSTGFNISIDNAADELAELEIEFTAMRDTKGNFYYEAITSELDVAEADYITDEWHAMFTPTLVKLGGVI
ncbi:phage tail protein [Schinkia azotoformans]|uniref:phage tail protein n=1 Tax=Schinkia azotoformans TaxID=1454 RepID=UPI002DBB8833|nr:phage tail protein [Schinkia azotoformans]MEC1778401.1 phage tail protein [Schinkia azotoformans]MED4328354.1 phage tail protein [Schinkia azotoformans]